MGKTKVTVLLRMLRWANIVFIYFKTPQADLYTDKNGEDHRFPEEEQISTVTTSNEPGVGQKRPRVEDDVKEEQSPPPRPNPTNQQVPNPNSLNGNYNGNGAGMGMVHGAVHGQGMVQGQDMRYDALYIGDLQWVRLSLVLSMCTMF
jgi:hypothetical protein